MTNTQPVDFYGEAKDLMPFLQSIEAKLAESNLHQLFHLVALRASQINQCAYCVKMHVREALEDGEKQERIDRLVVWRHVSDFSEAEKAAFAWVEALTHIKTETYAPLRTALREHFSEREIAALTAKTAMINLWNRIQISNY